MQTVLFDIETTAFTEKAGVMVLPETVHILAWQEYETGNKGECVGHKQINEFVHDAMEGSKAIIAHNGLGFDVPVLEHNFKFDRTSTLVLDSLVLCRMLHPDVKNEYDFELNRLTKEAPAHDPFKFEAKLIGSHSLEAWGLRLNPPCPKGKYSEEMAYQGLDPWANYNARMHHYCVQDVNVLHRLYKDKIEPSLHASIFDAVIAEHELAELMLMLKNSGIKFDRARAEAMTQELMAREKVLETQIQVEFPPRLEPTKWVYKPLSSNYYTTLMQKFPEQKLYRPQFVLPTGYKREMWGEITAPKLSRAVHEHVRNDAGKIVNRRVIFHASKADEEGNNCYTKCEVRPFNPGSRTQIARRLLEIGWQPEDFTESGAPSTDADTLNKLEEAVPAAKSIVTYLTVQKRLGQIATGDKAWLKLLDDDDYIHPTIIACSAVTSRATHADPNISQVPAVKNIKLKDAEGNVVLDDKGEPKLVAGWGEAGAWGSDCRACFTVPPGFKMVGVDLEGIELRAWGHYLAPFDQGKLCKIILEGILDPLTGKRYDVHESNRRILGFNDRTRAKRFLFALMYGAGDEKLGYIINPLASPLEQRALGSQARARFMAGVEGHSDLVFDLQFKARNAGYLIGLDGRRLRIRKEHAALNTMLQSAGAIISKYWILETRRRLEEAGMAWGYDKDYTLLIYSHDELDFAVREEHALFVKETCEAAARWAGEKLKMRIRIDAKGIIGDNWFEVH